MRKGNSCVKSRNPEHGRSRATPGSKIPGWDICEELLKDGISCRIGLTGSSMHPLLRDGDVVVIVPLGSRAPKRGEVVAAREPGSRRVVVHRIIARRKDGSYMLRGDNSPVPDGPFQRPDIIGRITEVERGGRKTLGVRLVPGVVASAFGQLRRRAGMRFQRLKARGRAC